MLPETYFVCSRCQERIDYDAVYVVVQTMRRGLMQTIKQLCLKCYWKRNA